MKVQLTGAILWDGEHRDIGEVLDLSDFDAHTLVARGRAKMYTPDLGEPVKPQNRSVGLQTSDAPKTVKRAYKRNTAK